VSTRAAEIAAKIAAVKGLAKPPDDRGADHDDATEQLSKTALAQIHEILEGVARKRPPGPRGPVATAEPVTDAEAQTLDEKVELPLPPRRGIDDDTSTTDQRLSPAFVTEHDPPPIDVEPEDETTTTTVPGTASQPPPPPPSPFPPAVMTRPGPVPPPKFVDPFAPLPPPKEEPPTDSDIYVPAVVAAASGGDPWMVPDTAVEPLQSMGGYAAPSDPREARGDARADSEPPTTIWDGGDLEPPPTGLRSADTLALVAGIAVAVALLAGIATYLLF
jgi:hypothetical protein